MIWFFDYGPCGQFIEPVLSNLMREEITLAMRDGIQNSLIRASAGFPSPLLEIKNGAEQAV